MTDDLEKLRMALKAAPPSPDAKVKEATLLRAMDNFDRLQEPAIDARPMSDRPNRAGFLAGVRTMLSSLKARPLLAGTTSLVAVCAALIIAAPAFRDHGRPAPTPAPAPMKAVAPAPEAKVASTAPESTDAAKMSSVPDTVEEAPPEASPVADTAATPAAGATDAELALPAAPMAETRLRKSEAPQGFAAGADVLAEPTGIIPETGTEAYANAAENPVKITAESPVSTFSIDIDTASYAVVRSYLSGGALPPPEAVRTEEMVNYFPYGYTAPAAGEAPFRTSVSLFPTPWNKDTELLRIGLQGRLPATADRPPLNLVFLIDTSGSMEDANKLPLLVQSFRLMLGQLRPEDQVAIVTYAGSAGEVLAPTPARDRAKILAALDNLSAGGSTAGEEGLVQAYDVAQGMKRDGSVTRVLLATDGDFNVGLADPEALKTFIAHEREGGTYLSVLGFGRGNLDDATMQALAQNGNGTAAYIDTLAEAQKVLVDQLTGALFPIADDVKIQIEFNPATVAEYRLIGYETRALNREDFNNDRVDAGEIGAGRQVTALYEVTPVGSPAQLSDPLRYGAAAATGGTSDELGFLRLRYKEPGAATSALIETPITAQPDAPDADARFAAAIAGFGQLLTGGKYLNGWGWTDAITLANGAKGEDAYGYRAEAVQLMRLAESLSHR